MANTGEKRELTAAEIGALSHLYRAEVYRSTIWRTRMDTTTNWSVVSLGIAFSVSFSSKEASALPLILTGLLVLFMLFMEGRRYRYFNVWRARARWMETHFFASMLEDGGLDTGEDWQGVLARDYNHPGYHISTARAVGRRLRRNYVWILLILSIAYIGKITVHPTPIADFSELPDRAALGPISGWVILGIGVLYNIAMITLAVATGWLDSKKHKGRSSESGMG